MHALDLLYTLYTKVNSIVSHYCELYKVGNLFQELTPVTLGRILALNKPEWGYIVLGCFGALVMGGQMPAFAVVISELLGVSENIHRRYIVCWQLIHSFLQIKIPASSNSISLKVSFTNIIS